MSKAKLGLVLLLVLFLGTPLLAQFQVLHSFSSVDGPNFGWDVFSTPLLVGSTLYGTTNNGGLYSRGTIFKVDTNGNNFLVIHNFRDDIAADGAYPYGSLRLVGSTIYGVTFAGGDMSYGTLWKIETNGTDFAVVHSFNGGTTDGRWPWEAPVLSGSTFYGTTEQGGVNGLGVIYKIDTDGTDFALIHSFEGGTKEGSYPQGGLILDGSTLYGMTISGGSSSDYGTVFKIGTDGNGFELLRAFAGYPSDGRGPCYGSLVLSGSTLYGMTQYGGAINAGVIFGIDTDGSDFTLLHSFGSSPADDGTYPFGSLVLDGSTLYGMTRNGGPADTGVIFGIETGGSGYEILHAFATGGSDGSHPYFDLTLDGSMLYGTTRYGGSAGYGTVFAYCTAPAADVYIIKDADNTTPVPNTDVNFTISAINDGPGGATGVKVTDLLPASLTYKSHSTVSGTYNPATGVWDIGPIAADATAVLHVTTTVNSSGTITNTASKTAQNEPDPDVTNNSESVTLHPVAQKLLLAPILLTPANNAAGQPTSVTLKWQDTNENPEEVKYKVRIKKQGGAYANYTVNKDVVQYIKSGLTLGKVYYWNVQAVGNGTSSKTSAWANGGVDFQFTVVPPVTLIAPTLVAPGNEASNIPLSIQLQWQDANSSPNEVKYKVRFKVAGGAYSNYTLAANTTTYTKSGLAKNKTYYWSVQAIGNGTSIKNSVWPADRTFTTIK
jgi:uncharacterized repeat protein (TIGR01451 family)